MGLMSDLFKRGIQFDGVSGLKTGANLEDLVTRAVPVSGTQLVDQVCLTDAASGSLVDDTGAAVRQLTIKDGGVSGIKLANGAGFGPDITLISAGIVEGGWDSGSLSAGDKTNILTASNTTASTALVNTSGSARQGGHVYAKTPSSALYLGTAFIHLQISSVSGSSTVLPFYSHQETISSGLVREVFPSGGSWGAAPMYGDDSGVYYDSWLCFPFFGKMFGFSTNAGAAGQYNIKIVRICAKGWQVDNI
jgi:hypothetical protein